MSELNKKFYDETFEKLNSIVTELENLYGLFQLTEEGITFSESNINIVVQCIKQQLRNKQRDSFKKTKQNIDKYNVLLAYVSSVMRFYDSRMLDFSFYSEVQEMGDIFTLFLHDADIKRESVNLVNRVIEIVANTDDSESELKFSLAYRYIRVWIATVITSDFVNSSIIADFLVSQMCMTEEGC